MSSASAPTLESLETEVRRLSGGYANWITGKAGPKSQELLEESFGQYLSDDFHMVVTWGDVLPKEELIPFIKAGYGMSKGLKITLDGFRMLCKPADNLTMVTYRETQVEPKHVPVERRITALLETLDDGTFKWRHIHIAFPYDLMGKDQQKEGGINKRVHL